jgi:tyrosyl-tRNA synthetase
MIGDPSGKSDERNLLDEATLNHNVEGIKAVLSRFLDFNSKEANGAVLVNNYDWIKSCLSSILPVMWVYYRKLHDGKGFCEEKIVR